MMRRPWTWPWCWAPAGRPHRGGPLHYGEQRGWDDVVQALTALAARHGPRFEPCAALRRRVGSLV